MFWGVWGFGFGEMGGGACFGEEDRGKFVCEVCFD